MRKRKPTAVPQAVVRPDSRDGSKDYTIPLAEAQRLYDEGKLDRDLTNGGYMLPRKTK